MDLTIQKKIALVLVAVLFILAGFGLLKTTSAGEDHQTSLTVSELFTAFPKKRNQAPVSAATVASGKSVNVPILMYHHVGGLPAGADAITTDLTVPASAFAEQVNWLKSQGFNTITLHDLFEYSLGKFKMPTKPLIFTFDDGYSDVFENAIPALTQYGYVGSFGIITAKVGHVEGNNTYATWDQIKSASDSGMEIVSHTNSHFDGTNPKYSLAYERDDIAQSLKELKSHLNTSTNILIYPYGHYNEQYRQAMHAAGVVMGVTEIHSADVNLSDLDEVPRLRVHGRESLTTFERVINDRVK